MSLITATARASSPTRFNGANTAPVNFNPATYPIIARHWFGIEPFRPIGQVAADSGRHSLPSTAQPRTAGIVRQPRSHARLNRMIKE